MHIARNVISCLILSALMSAVFAHAHWILPAPRTGENNNIGQCGGVVAGRPGGLEVGVFRQTQQSSMLLPMPTLRNL